MKNSFTDLLRQPDDILVQYENSPLRFEESSLRESASGTVECLMENGCLKVILYPTAEPVKRIRLRFEEDQNGVTSILGDALARGGGDDMHWTAFIPHKLMPWYFHAYDGTVLHSYGVRTGANSFALWQADPRGITLWLDVRNGGGGIQLREPLLCAEIVCRRGEEGEDPFVAAQDFCAMMCPAPKLPSTPVYGFNNWYWAYGGIDEATVLHESEYLGRLTENCATRPLMVIDDGWQTSHAKGYNGGPWHASNECFPSMEETAARIKERGCRPGVWMRPLLTMTHVPDEAIYRSPSTKFGTVMDPSHPFTLERVAADVSRIAGWGFAMIKHDFTTDDLFGIGTVEIPDVGLPAHFYDTTKTNAQIVTNLYRTIEASAGNALVLGCDTINHLAAGIHPLQRVGNDTSGRSFEWTRRYGVHALMRLPQNGRFFKVDPDCAAFTERVPIEKNLDYLEAAAICGCATFASVKPGILSPEEEKRIRRILETAAAISPESYARPTDWTRTTEPSAFLYEGKEICYDWYSAYRGARRFLTWMA